MAFHGRTPLLKAVPLAVPPGGQPFSAFREQASCSNFAYQDILPVGHQISQRR